MPHWLFDTKDADIGIIGPSIYNCDVEEYDKKHPIYSIEHVHSKFSSVERHQLIQSASNAVRLKIVDDMHQKYKKNKKKFLEEMNKIRILDGRDKK